jgi:radical SAM protein with 4Fe4S-binding SPASM domain
MSTKIHNKVIDEIAAAGKGITRFLRYTGDGEPLIHPNLSSLISYAFEHTSLPINLTTNGSFLTLPTANQLVNAGVRVFDISIDAATEETYRLVRVGGDYSTVVNNVLSVIEEFRKDERVSIVVSFVRQQLNEKEVSEFQKFWSSNGVRRVIIRNGHSAAGSIPAKAIELWKSAPKVRTACLYPWERLVVKADGEVTYCPADWHHIAGMGNIEFQSLLSIWQSEVLRKLRFEHVHNKLNPDSLCGQCPDWSVIQWPHEANTYASLMHEIEREI